MIIIKKYFAVLASALLMSVTFEVSAVPITGEIGMGGAYQAVDILGAATTNNLATGIEFTPELFIVNSATDTFATEIISPTGAIKSFQFTDTDIVDFWTIDGFSFELSSVINTTTAGSAFLDLEGTGIISHSSYDDTLGNWSFTGNSAGGLFSWSAGSAVSAPEPGMLALMGIGFIGFAVGRRKYSK